MAGVHTHSFHGNMVLSWHSQPAILAPGRRRGGAENHNTSGQGSLKLVDQSSGGDKISDLPLGVEVNDAHH